MSNFSSARSRYKQLSNERTEHLSALAEDVADAFSRYDRFEPLEVLADREITWSFGHYGEAFDGALECRNSRFHVYCNLVRVGHRQSARARFTLAHEIGHYYIDEHRRALAQGRAPTHPSKCEFESDRLVEREADFFATHLLMPTDRFVAAAGRFRPGMEGILSLCEIFGTSITSTAIRYAKCDVMPCAIMKWHSTAFGWCWFSDGMYAKRLGRPMNRVAKVPRDSATALALNGAEPPKDQRFHQSGGTASFWFSRKATIGGDPILREQAVSLGQYGALTLLFPDRI